MRLRPFHKTIHRPIKMRRTSITSGKAISQHALDAVNQDAKSGTVQIKHIGTSSTSHTWVPIYDRVSCFWIITIFSHCKANLDLARGVYCCGPCLATATRSCPAIFSQQTTPGKVFGLTFISFFQFFILTLVTTHNTQNIRTGRCNL